MKGDNVMKTNTKKMVTLSMLSAISVILVFLIRIPFPGAPFLEYDPADVSIIIATLIYGPLSGLMVTVAVSVLQGITVSAGSGGLIGIIMHIFSTGMFVVATGFLRKNLGEKYIIVAVMLGALAMTLTMILWNLIFTPLFMNQPFEVVKGMIIPVILPFNLIKSFLNGFISLLVYSVIKRVL